jgi:RHS repeat-associated protein
MGYDDRDRLTSAANGPLWGGSHTFAYDPIDNLRRTVNPTFGDWTYVYNATTRRLDHIDPTAGGSAILTYGYDTRGRAASRALAGTSQTFVVDLADRVTSVGPSVATYRYDGYGRRTSVTKASTTTVQVYSQAGQLMYQSSPASDGIFRSGFQSSDTPYPASTGGNKRYIYLGRHLIAEDGTTGRSYIHTDGLGSPARTTNASGVPSGREDYKPYGWGPTPQSKPGFTGHVTDAETGLSYMQARYYDPFAGRFLAVDPVDASAVSFNRYWYANNSPYKNIDPDGREAGCITLGVSCFDSGGTFGQKLGATLGLAGFGIGSVAGGGFAATFAATAANVGVVGATIVHTPEIVTIGVIGAEGLGAISGVAGPASDIPIMLRAADLHLPPTRAEGADMFKLARQISQHGDSLEGMPALQVTQGANGTFMINDGVTRATRAVMTAGEKAEVPAVIIESKPSWDMSKLPYVKERIP